MSLSVRLEETWKEASVVSSRVAAAYHYLLIFNKLPQGKLREYHTKQPLSHKMTVAGKRQGGQISEHTLLSIEFACIDT